MTNSQTKFKETEVGPIPEDWEVLRLLDICELQRGFDLPTNNRRKGKYPVMASTGINSYHDEYKVKSPGVVTGRSGSLGKCLYINKDFWPLNTTLWVKNFKGNDPYFIYLLLSTMAFEQFNSGSGVPTLNRNHVHQLKVALPPLIEQKKIVEILGALDEKIELNRKMNKTLESLGHAIFKRWFVSKSRSEKVLVLGDILETIESGRRPKGGVGKYKEGVPSIGAENINGLANYSKSKDKYVPNAFFDSMRTGLLKNKDVLLYKDGALIGRKTIYRNDYPYTKCCINEHVFILRTRDQKLQNFLYFWLDQREMTESIINLNSNAAQPGINQEQVRSLRIIIPNNTDLEKIDNQFELLLDKIYDNAKENETLSQIRDSLLPRLMSGKLRVG